MVATCRGVDHISADGEPSALLPFVGDRGRSGLEQFQWPCSTTSLPEEYQEAHLKSLMSLSQLPCLRETELGWGIYSTAGCRLRFGSWRVIGA